MKELLDNVLGFLYMSRDEVDPDASRAHLLQAIGLLEAANKDRDPFCRVVEDIDLVERCDPDPDALGVEDLFHLMIGGMCFGCYDDDDVTEARDIKDRLDAALIRHYAGDDV